MQALSLFEDIITDAPITEGIKYAGSKLKLLPHILQLVGRVEARTVMDAFSGTTRVAQALAQSGYSVICNDLAVWSEVFGVCYLLNEKKPDQYRSLIDHLNALKPVDGWFSEHYGGLPNGGSALHCDGLKKPWQMHNTRKLDAIREEIDNLALPAEERAVALTSLMLALDRVDSTLGHYVSYLQNWSPRSYNELVLRVPHIWANQSQHTVFRDNVFDVLPRVRADLAYLDPPYGSNNEKMPPSRVRYASYYHLWTTVCLHDRPVVCGRSKRRADSSDIVAGSVFEEFRKDANGTHIAVKAIGQLLSEVQARWVILSYSSGGRATAHELDEVIKANGKLLEVVELDYRRNVMAEMKWTNEWVRDTAEPNHEFLFLIEKR